MRPAIYLDNNATTRPDPRVVDAMVPYLREHFGNASSRHRFGGPAAVALASARRTVAACLGASPGDVVFTSGGTEANNLALRGAVLAAKRPRHVIISAVEHPAVLDTCAQLQSQGECELTVLAVDGQGALERAQLERALRPGETCIVSMMWANNETGVLFPIDEIGARVRTSGALFHVDAVQAVGKLAIDWTRLPVDLLSLSAHKLHGPKGVGALLVRSNARLAIQITGGGQEHGRRSGTENIPGIVGLATALQLAVEQLPEAAARQAQLRDRLQQELAAAIPALTVTAASAARLPNTLHVTLPVEADALLLLLDRAGIAASAGSACSSGAHTPSHVLSAMGIAPERIHGAVRFSLSRDTTTEEIDTTVSALPPLVDQLARLGQSGAASARHGARATP